MTAGVAPEVQPLVVDSTRLAGIISTSVDKECKMRGWVHRLGPIVMGLLIFGGCFAASFVSALHEPKPHGLRLGIAAPPPITAQLQKAAQSHGDAVTIHPYASPANAEHAVRHHDVAGALVIEQPPKAALFIASAGGPAAAQVITAAIAQQARSSGMQLTIRDLVPLPAHDREGISAVFLTISLVLPSLAFAIAVSLRAGDAPAAVTLTAAAVFAVLLGSLNTWIADGIIGALVGHPWRLAGLATLASFAISGTTIACRRLLGLPGIALAALVLVVYGVPASGVAVGPSFTPSFFRHLAESLPAGAALSGFRDAVYFSAGGRQAWVLVGWVVGAVLVAGTADGVRRIRHRPHTDSVTPVPAVP